MLTVIKPVTRQLEPLTRVVPGLTLPLKLQPSGREICRLLLLLLLLLLNSQSVLQVCICSQDINFTRDVCRPILFTVHVSYWHVLCSICVFDVLWHVRGIAFCHYINEK